MKNSEKLPCFSDSFLMRLSTFWTTCKQITYIKTSIISNPIQWIYPLARSKTPPKEVSRIWHWTASDSEAAVLEIWGMYGTCSLPLFYLPLWPRMVVPVRVPSMGQIDLCKDYPNSKWPCTKKALKNNCTKIYIGTCDEHDSQTCRHKIALNRLTCRQNQSLDHSIYLFDNYVMLSRLLLSRIKIYIEPNWRKIF